MTTPFTMQTTQSAPINGWITPTLDTPYVYNGSTEAARCIMVGVAGAVSIVDANGATVVLPALAAGVVHYIISKQINTVGTVATGLLVGF